MVLNFYNENFVALNLVYGRGEALHFFILDTSTILGPNQKNFKIIPKVIVKLFSLSILYCEAPGLGLSLLKETSKNSRKTWPPTNHFTLYLTLLKTILNQI